MRELEPRPREEVMKYAIPADRFPVPCYGYSRSGYMATQKSVSPDNTPVAPVTPVPQVQVAPVTATPPQSSYVPPHLRGKTQTAGQTPVPEHHVSATSNKPATPEPSRYVPPHLRNKASASTASSVTTSTSVKKPTANDFPSLGGASSSTKSSSTKMTPWAKKSFATIAALPEPEVVAPVVDTYSSAQKVYRDGMEVLVMQRQNHGNAMFNQYLARTGGVGETDHESDDEVIDHKMHQTHHYSDDDCDDENYDDEDAENDKYYTK